MSTELQVDPKEFLNWYGFDRRMVTGEFYDPEPITVEEGDKVGVVLLNMGGPDNLDAIQPFLYNLFMDPAIIDIPLPNFLRSPLSSFISWYRGGSKEEEYEAIGGGSPLIEFTGKQGKALEKQLRSRMKDIDVSFSIFYAMRYWRPFTEEVAKQMKRDGIDKVLLLPLYPHYSKTTTGSSLSYWKFLDERDHMGDWSTTYVKEYATHPRYLDALSDRIDEGIEKFPEDQQDDVHLVFSAHGTPVKEMKERRDPYCCLVHATVDRLLKKREEKRPFHTAFQSQVGPAEWLKPSTTDKVKELADGGVESVLVIPVAFVSDHIETDFELDIELREEAEEWGITHFEVMDGLNEHPAFIDALEDLTLSQIDFSPELQDQLNDENVEKKGQTELPKYEEDDRHVRCVQCDYVSEGICWDDR